MDNPVCPNCDAEEKPQEYYIRWGELPGQVHTRVRLWRCDKCEHITQAAGEYGDHREIEE